MKQQQNDKKPAHKQKEYPVITINENDNFFVKAWKWYRIKSIESRKKHDLPKTFGETLWSWTKTIVWAIIVVMILNGILIASFVVPTGSMENTVMTGDFLFVNKFLYGPSTPQVIPFFNVPLPFYKFPGVSTPEQGDVIVFIYPGNRDELKPVEFQYYLKRCVATAGDTLVVANKRIFVNHKEFALPEHGKFDPYSAESQYDKFRTYPIGAGFTPNNYGPIRIPMKGDILNITPQNWRQWEIFIKREGHDVSFDGSNIMIDGKRNSTYTVNRSYCFGMGDNRDNSLDSRFFGFIPWDNVVGTPMVVYMSLPDTDENGAKYSLLDRILHLRISRIGKIIH